MPALPRGALADPFTPSVIRYPPEVSIFPPFPP